MNLMSQHIPFAKLADLAEGSLPGTERDASLAHLKDCSRCSAQLERVEQVVNLMRHDTLEDAPRDVISQAVGIFQRSLTGAKQSLLRRVIAALSFDSASLTPAYGVRSGQTATRQLLYSTGENELDLRVTPDEEAWIVSGQVLGQEQCAGGEVQLESVAGSAAAAELNELCEFTLPPVAAGSYTLRLRLSNLEIEIPEFELRA
jgi:anti-sigma factor ChrR (cupin superfamily)